MCVELAVTLYALNCFEEHKSYWYFFNFSTMKWYAVKIILTEDNGQIPWNVDKLSNTKCPQNTRHIKPPSFRIDMWITKKKHVRIQMNSYKQDVDPNSHIDWTRNEYLNSLRPKLNRRPFADDIFKCIFLNENEWISLRISRSLFLGFELTIFLHWFR